MLQRLPPHTPQRPDGPWNSGRRPEAACHGRCRNPTSLASGEHHIYQTLRSLSSLPARRLHVTLETPESADLRASSPRGQRRSQPSRNRQGLQRGVADPRPLSPIVLVTAARCLAPRTSVTCSLMPSGETHRSRLHSRTAAMRNAHLPRSSWPVRRRPTRPRTPHPRCTRSEHCAQTLKRRWQTGSRRNIGAGRTMRGSSTSAVRIE
jgi:hypothetical protein